MCFPLSYNFIPLSIAAFPNFTLSTIDIYFSHSILPFLCCCIIQILPLSLSLSVSVFLSLNPMYFSQLYNSIHLSVAAFQKFYPSLSHYYVFLIFIQSYLLSLLQPLRILILSILFYLFFSPSFNLNPPLSLSLSVI